MDTYILYSRSRNSRVLKYYDHACSGVQIPLDVGGGKGRGVPGAKLQTYKFFSPKFPNVCVEGGGQKFVSRRRDLFTDHLPIYLPTISNQFTDDNMQFQLLVYIGEYIPYSPLIIFRLIIPSNIHLQLIIPSNIHLQYLCSTKNEKKTT